VQRITLSLSYGLSLIPHFQQADFVNVELANPLSTIGAGVLAQKLLKHLLFMRQQIPL
jgi:hypothetical protein